MISTRPFLYTPTHEYVVPRSIPMTVPGPPPGTSGLAAAATATAPRPPMPIRRLPSRTRPNPTRADGAVVFIAAVVAGEGRAMVCGCRRGQALVRDRSSGLRWWGWRWWGWRCAWPSGLRWGWRWGWLLETVAIVTRRLYRANTRVGFVDGWRQRLVWFAGGDGKVANYGTCA